MRGVAQAATQPRAARAAGPFVEHQAEPGIFPMLRAESFDHGVAGDRIGQRAGDARVPQIGQHRCGRHPADRHGGGDGQMNRATNDDGQAKQRPLHAQDDGGADDNDRGGQQAQHDHVIEHIHRAGAAQHLAHDGAGEAFRMPRRGKPLHPGKGFRFDVLHHAQREAHDAPEGELPGGQPEQAQQSDAGNGRQRLAAPLRARGIADGIDQPAGRKWASRYRPAYRAS